MDEKELGRKNLEKTKRGRNGENCRQAKSRGFGTRRREEIRGKMSKGTKLKEGKKWEDGSSRRCCRRLPLYLRVLEDWMWRRDRSFPPTNWGAERCHPRPTAQGSEFFGVFGKQGVGYNTLYLREELRRILRLNQQVNVGLVKSATWAWR